MNLSGALFVASFGVIGVLLRWCLQLVVTGFLGMPTFWGTLGINALGSFLIGVMSVVARETALFSEHVSLGLMVGLLGGFTTFSSYSLESLSLFYAGNWISGFVYFLGSPVVGLVAAASGVAAARIF